LVLAIPGYTETSNAKGVNKFQINPFKVDIKLDKLSTLIDCLL